MPGPKSTQGAKANNHLTKKVEAQEKAQAADFVKNRSSELDKEIEAMEARLASRNAATAAELSASGQMTSGRILDSRAFFSKLKARMLDNNLKTKGKQQKLSSWSAQALSLSRSLKQPTTTKHSLTNSPQLTKQQQQQQH
jgi:hypothetical protein